MPLCSLVRVTAALTLLALSQPTIATLGRHQHRLPQGRPYPSPRRAVQGCQRDSLRPFLGKPRLSPVVPSRLSLALVRSQASSSTAQQDTIALFSATLLAMRPTVAVTPENLTTFLRGFLTRMLECQNETQLVAGLQLMGSSVNKRAQGELQLLCVPVGMRGADFLGPPQICPSSSASTCPLSSPQTSPTLASPKRPARPLCASGLGYGRSPRIRSESSALTRPRLLLADCQGPRRPLGPAWI